MNPKQYSDEEVREILKRAVDYQTQDEFQYSRDQLFDLGKEIGLSEDAIVKAEQSYTAKRGVETPVSPRLSVLEIPVEQAEMEFRRHRVGEFRQQLFTFAAIITFLFFINLATTQLDPPWFVFPALGMGLATVFQFLALRRTDGDEYEKSFDDWLEKRESRARKRRRRLESDRGDVL